MSPADLVAIRQSARATREALLLRRTRAAARSEPNAAEIGSDVERLTRHVLALTEPPPLPDSFLALADLDLTADFTTAASRLQSAACGPGAPYQAIEAARVALDALREAQRALAVAREAARVALGRLDAAEKDRRGA